MMASLEPISFNGCAPTPLASYLKALGVLRLLSSLGNHVNDKPADPQARGWWENEQFYLNTTLSSDDVLRFFLEDYAPSPIIAPWNGRSGFLEEEDSKRTGARLMRVFEKSDAARFQIIKQAIKLLRENKELAELNDLRVKISKIKNELKQSRGEEKKAKELLKKDLEKKDKQAKSVLLPTLRSEIKSDHLSFVDACFILSADEVAMPLLGSGGNDGSQDFCATFVEQLEELFDLDGSVKEIGRSLLNDALFGGGRFFTKGTMGQFSPGQGGKNATTGYLGKNTLNPWDFVLAMEGTLVFSGALTRSWGATGDSRAAFPFTFEPTGAAAGIFSSEDPNRPRGEVWTPLWKKPATFREIKAIFSEGRLTLSGRTARTGLDAARSVAQMGVSRGIASFERYSMIQTDSKMPYQATPLGRIVAIDRPRREDLIADLEYGGWLERAQRICANKSGTGASSIRARNAMRRLEDSLFQMTDSMRLSEGIRNALMALGEFVSWLSKSPKARPELKPPPRLSRDWILRADDGTPEFRIAVALAGLGCSSSSFSDEQLSKSPDNVKASASVVPDLPMVAHFAPINERSVRRGRLPRQLEWSSDFTEMPPTVVWSAGNLVSNMAAVLERRIIEGVIRSLPDKPLTGATHARIADVMKFIVGDFNDARCASLLAGLIWVAPTQLSGRNAPVDTPVSYPPFAYSVLKTIFSSNAALRRIGAIDGEGRLPLIPGLLPRLRSGGGNLDGRVIDKEVRAALNRARGSGLASPFDSGGFVGAATSRFGVGIRSDRLTAALLIPIGEFALKTLLERAWPQALNRDSNQPEEIANVT